MGRPARWTAGGAAARRRRAHGRRPAPLAFTLKAPAGKLRVSGRVVRVKIGCACSYDAKLTLKGRTIARKKGTAKKGATVAIKLSAKQARAVRKLGPRVEGAQARGGAKSGGAAGTRSVVVAPR